MLIDTHCHVNAMIKTTDDIQLNFSSEELDQTNDIITQATKHDVRFIINVGTSLIESINCIGLAQRFNSMFAVVGIHPNDCTDQWRTDFFAIQKLVRNKEANKIIGIGECGVDRHYPQHNLPRQYDAFKAHIELALEYDLALVIHSRDAYDETLKILEQYKHDVKRAVMHCFSYDTAFAQLIIEWGFFLGIGGTVTYPKNEELRTIVKNVDAKNIVLETDAPFLPPQIIRGKKNHPLYIQAIAHFIAELREMSYNDVAHATTANAVQLFNLTNIINNYNSKA